jgi:ParB-like chromosome segregation protein Spo0J
MANPAALAAYPVLEVFDCPVAAIDPHPDNPRMIGRDEYNRLLYSLQARPDMLRARPVIVQRSTGFILGGNMRYRAWVDLGNDTIPAILADVDDTEALDWLMRDNTQAGAWHDDGLSELVYRLARDGGDLRLTGFGDDELSTILSRVAGAFDLPDLGIEFEAEPVQDARENPERYAPKTHTCPQCGTVFQEVGR